jgi:hypothetical protein
MYIGLVYMRSSILNRVTLTPKRYLSKKTIRNAIENYPQFGTIYLDDTECITSSQIRKRVLPNFSEMNSFAFSLEHIQPISFLKEVPVAKYDFHNLFLTRSFINLHRSNYRFVDEEYMNNFNNIKRDLCKISRNHLSSDNNHIHNFSKFNYKSNNHNIFIPIHNSRGKIARTLAYMKYVYPQIRLTNVIDKKTLLKWNDIYPVSKEEFERNKLIKELQGNTNPFIDGSIRFN